METLIATITALDITGILSGLALIVAGAAVLATITPTPKDDAILAKLKKVLDFLALNIGKAKNANEVEDKDAK